MEFATGGHLVIRITPDDVGKRVSVRSLTDSGDPSGRFTDTIGVLSGWSEGTLRLTRRDGATVTLDESTLVAGKAVPPAPARRRGLPVASARELQRVAARAWPAVETEGLDGWTLRASVDEIPATDGRTPPREGFTARANSVLVPCDLTGSAAARQPEGEPGSAPDLDTALHRVRSWYAARRLTARIQVSTGAADCQELLVAELDRRGWTAERHALLCTAALAPLADRAPDSRVRVRRRLDEYWARGYTSAPAGPDSAAARVLGGGPSVWFASVDGDLDRQHPAAIGRCVVDGRWAGFTAMSVAAEHRRRGLGGAVLAELARTALDEGASAAYLQVEPDNTAARGLYEGLGFAEHHAYHFRVAPAPS